MRFDGGLSTGEEHKHLGFSPPEFPALDETSKAFDDLGVVQKLDWLPPGEGPTQVVLGTRSRRRPRPSRGPPTVSTEPAVLEVPLGHDPGTSGGVPVLPVNLLRRTHPLPDAGVDHLL